MTPELYQRLKPLYDAALDVPKEQRAQFVYEACRDDPELREHLEALLAAHDESTGPLDAPARKPPETSIRRNRGPWLMVNWYSADSRSCASWAGEAWARSTRPKTTSCAAFTSR